MPVFHPLLGQPWLSLAIFFAVLLLAWTLYRGVRSGRRALVLGVLRALALLALVLMLLQPQKSLEKITILKPQLAVLVDNSQSMAERVDPNQPTRSEQAANWMRSPLLKKLRDDFDLRIFGFDQAPTEFPGFEALTFKGSESNIESSLARLREQFAGQPLAAILLLSDGLERSDLGARPAAQSGTGSPGAPVFSFELERPYKAKQLPKLISVANLDYPPRITVGWDTEVRAALSARGMNGQTITVELWRNGEKAFESPVSFNQDEQTRQVAFPVSQAVPGVVNYELRIKDPAADKSARSNPFVIEAMAPGNRILYIQNALGFDFKFLRKAILSDRNLQLSAYVRWADGRMVNIAESGGATSSLELSSESLKGTAVVILGDLSPEALAPAQCTALREFVDRGGGLVLLGGPNSLTSPAFSKTALAPLFPAKVPADYKEGQFPMKITKTGLHHPVFGSLFTTIEDFPPLLTLNLSTGSAPNAEVLVETVISGKAYPTVTTMRFGQGRVFMILSDTLWRWRLAANSWSSNRSPYDTFWAQLMDWLLPKEQQKQESNRLELFSEKSNYLLGQQPEIRALVSAVGAALPTTIPLQLQTPDDKTFEYTLHPGSFTGRDGRPVSGYRVSVEPNMAGVFQAKAAVSLNGTKIEGETRFVVSAPAGELTGKSIDRENLRRIARNTGGAYYPADQWDQWRQALHVQEQHTSKTELIDLWNHPLLLALVLLALALEWGARKFWNLP